MNPPSVVIVEESEWMLKESLSELSFDVFEFIVSVSFSSLAEFVLGLVEFSEEAEEELDRGRKPSFLVRLQLKFVSVMNLIRYVSSSIVMILVAFVKTFLSSSSPAIISWIGLFTILAILVPTIDSQLLLTNFMLQSKSNSRTNALFC